MVAVTWPEFAHLHPFAPRADRRHPGLVDELGGWLCRITGYDAVSLQPNAGSQGELSGLLAIAAYHRSRGEDRRKVCLIPSSAHGTNAASAVMAGSGRRRQDGPGHGQRGHGRPQGQGGGAPRHPGGDHGHLPVDARRLRGHHHRPLRGGARRRWPGVRRRGQPQRAGRGGPPRRFGADVSHLNLHKTFCIPHGGGGPGVGPVLPGAPGPVPPQPPSGPGAGPERASGRCPRRRTARRGSCPSRGPTSAHGRRGPPAGPRWPCSTRTTWRPGCASTTRCCTPAPTGLVAHECILDLRSITKETGVTVDDVAKRLIDYGFHAPTMSSLSPGRSWWSRPRARTRARLDRFCDAMVAIRQEIDEVASGGVAAGDSVLRGRPTRRSHWPGTKSTPTTDAPRRTPGASSPRRSTGPRCAGSTEPTVTVISWACPPPEAFEG